MSSADLYFNLVTQWPTILLFELRHGNFNLGQNAFIDNIKVIFHIHGIKINVKS